MGFVKTAPMRYLLLITGAWLLIFLLTRAVLLLTHLDEVGGNLLPVFAVGLVYDLGFLAYAALPLGLYVLLCPPGLWRRRGHRWFLQAVLTVSIFAMLFTSVAEWLFWDEFGVRFNFIAVDYLVYSDEVLNNLLESYPIGKLLSLLAMLAVVLSLVLRKPFNAAMDAPLPPLRGRLLNALVLVLAVGLSLQLISQDSPRTQGGNAYKNELASNGPYQFSQPSVTTSWITHNSIKACRPKLSPSNCAPNSASPTRASSARTHWISAAPSATRARCARPISCW